jgi:hypothetical protein
MANEWFYAPSQKTAAHDLLAADEEMADRSLADRMNTAACIAGCSIVLEHGFSWHSHRQRESA